MEPSDTWTTDRFVVNHDFEEDGRLGYTILRSVAAIEGVRPEDLRTQFHAVVDPDALDRIFRPSERHEQGGDRRVVFSLEGYEVAVQDGDPVTVVITG